MKGQQKTTEKSKADEEPSRRKNIEQRFGARVPSNPYAFCFTLFDQWPDSATGYITLQRYKDLAATLSPSSLSFSFYICSFYGE